MLVKLVPDSEQHAELLRTLHTFNAACARIAEVAFAARCANKLRLQKTVYRPIRKEFGLSSQMAVRAIAKVCEAYKRGAPCLEGPDGEVPDVTVYWEWEPGCGRALDTQPQGRGGEE